MSVPSDRGAVSYTGPVPSPLDLSPEGRLLFAGKALRTFGFGWLSLILALFLERRGFAAPAIGAVFTATLVEDAAFTIVVASRAQRLGRRRVLLFSAFLVTAAGAVLAMATHPLVILVAAVLGTLSPNGQDAGPFSPLEQALLPDTVPAWARTRAFAWYNIFGFLPSALGALAAGAWQRGAQAMGLDDLTSYRWMLWGYSLLGVALAAVYSRLPRRLDAPPPANPRPAGGRMGLHRSRGVVLQMSALQALDSLAGGFVVQALLVYWFHLRFGAGPDVLGPLFFGTSVLSAASFLVAARLADRFGLLQTAVFTHIPSNVLLMLVPLAGSLPVAGGLLLARHLLSQMDVPTRQAYTMALVDADERAATAGFTASARGLAAAVAPVLTGFALARAATGLPFFLAGGLKIVYDLALYFRFRRVRLP
jgi:MFS family permease